VRKLAAGLALLCACRSEPSTDKLIERSRREPPPAASTRPEPARSWHRGPGVAAGASGTARFASRLFSGFDAGRALSTAAFADGFHREPGNEGFEAVIDHVRGGLEAAGFGADDRLTLEVLETPLRGPAWTPRRARLALQTEGGTEVVLHAFDEPAGRDRVMLPRNAPSAGVAGPIVLSIEEIAPGAVLATGEELSSGLLRRAHAAGAAAVLSAALAPYNEDTSGAARHLDAIAYRSVDRACPLPVAQISPRSLGRIRAACGRGARPRIALEAEVGLAERPLRTLVATVRGTRFPEECVVLAAHVQEPGACDNASGVATLLEGARTTAMLLLSGAVEPPARSLVFLWGDEMAQSRVYLEHGRLRPIAAVAADMTGQSRDLTGALPLLERAPDPGAVGVLPPDEHTSWGASPVETGELAPSGLSLIAREALHDVAALAGGWQTAEHPFEGGSDHVVFLRQRIPAVLFWHFTDFAYHTSLDRLEHVDPQEMRRTGAVILATALAVADARPGDLARHLESLRIEQELRLSACAEAQRPDLDALWREWFQGARMWLRDLCLHPPRPETQEPP